MIYLMPVQEDTDRANCGEIVLGGCMVVEVDPEWRCNNEGCTAEWSREI